MPNCLQGTNYLLVSGGSTIRDLNLSANGKELVLKQLPSGTVECTYSIDSGNYTGLKTIGSNLQLSAELSGKTNSVEIDAGNNPGLNIELSGGILQFIGTEDLVIKLTVPGADGVNIRYDRSTNIVSFKY